MIRVSAGIAFIGGATLALLSGCVEVPATGDQQPVPSAAMQAYLEQERAYIEQETEARAYFEQQNAWRQQFPVKPDDAPVKQAPAHHHAVSADDGPDLSALISPATAAKAPVDPRCVGWWRICHFL
jgi:hypothetical protein